MTKWYYRIINCAMEVLNTVGHGFLVKPHELAMAIELDLRQLPFVQQRRFDITYKGKRLGTPISDLIVCDAVVVETKSIAHITDHELGQMLNYLRVTGHEVGLILNFKRAKLEWKRVVLDAKD